MKANRMPDLIENAQEKFAAEGVNLAMEHRLRPFLFDESQTGTDARSERCTCSIRRRRVRK